MPAPHAEALLAQLEFTVLRRLDGILQGDYRSLFKGAGLDFADLREYQYYDDVRRIDWNATARAELPYVRDFREDREVTAWFLLDLSGSLDFGSQQESKLALSMAFAGLMARIWSRHGNRVGAMLYGQRFERLIPAASGRRQVLNILRSMQAPRLAGAGTETQLADLLGPANHLIKARSVVFVVSDFFSQPGWAKALQALSQRHEVVAVRLCDALESELPDLGMLLMQDAESGEQIYVDTHDAGFRRRFAAQAVAREAGLRSELATAGVDTLELNTDGDLAASLIAFARDRKQRSRLNSGSLPTGPRAGTTTGVAA